MSNNDFASIQLFTGTEPRGNTAGTKPRDNTADAARTEPRADTAGLDGQGTS